MAGTTASSAKSYHGTLSATPGEVDVITITGAWGGIEVINRAAAGEITVVQGDAGNPPADPTHLVAGSEVVLPGSFIALEAGRDDAGTTLKLVSNTASLAYSIIGVQN